MPLPRLRRAALPLALVLAALLGACRHDPVSILPGMRRDGVPGDTIVGTGSVVELRAWRDEWVRTRAGRDYRYTVRHECFCPPAGWTEVTVSGDSAIAVTRDGAPVTYPAQYGTIEAIYARAIRAREEGQPVQRAVYHESGYPASLSFGPWAVDGGVAYYIRDVAFLP